MGIKEALKRAQEYYDYYDQKEAERFRNGESQNYVKTLKDMEKKMSASSASYADFAAYDNLYRSYQKMLGMSGMQPDKQVASIYDVVASNASNQASNFYKTLQSGRSVDENTLTGYKTALEWLEQLTDEAADEKTKSRLSEITKQHKNFYKDFDSINSAMREQNQLRAKRDEAENESFWNELGSGLLSVLAAYGGGENASNAAQVRETSQAEKAIAEKAAEKQQLLQEQINKNYEKYVALLDREALKKSLHDGSLTGKEKDYAEEDYQMTDEYVKSSMAADALQKSREVQGNARAAGQARANTQLERERFKASVLLNGRQNIDFNTLIGKYGEESKERLVARLKEMGYKTTDGVTVEDVAEYLIDKNNRKINFENARNLHEDIEQLSQTAGGRALGSAVALATAPLKTFGTAETLKKTVEDWFTDEKVYMDANHPAYAFNNLYSDVTSSVASEIKEKYGEGWGDAMSEAYQFGMTLADNGIRAATTLALGGGKVAQAVTLVTMGAGVMNDTAVELTKMGMDAKSAGTLSAVAGLAEIATEALPMEKVMGILKQEGSFSKQAVRKILLTQVFTEGLEEGTSDLINDAADMLYERFSTDPSRRQLEIKRLMEEENLSFEEAYTKWNHEHTLEYVKDVAGGMLSGGLMAGGSMKFASARSNAKTGAGIMFGSVNSKNAVNNEINSIIKSAAHEGLTLTKEQANEIRLRNAVNSENGFSYGDAYEKVLQEGLQSTDESIRKRATELTNERDTKGKQSLVGIGKLANSISLNKTNIAIGTATQMLESVGTPDNVIDAVTGAIKGEELSNREVKRIQSSPDAMNVMAQLYESATGEAVNLDENSSADDIREIAGRLYGTTFEADNTAAGRLYQRAAALRAEDTIGYNGMKGFVAGYNENLNMEPEAYEAMFSLAYNLAKAGHSTESILERIYRSYPTSTEQQKLWLSVAVERAIGTAQSDIEYEQKKAARRAAEEKKKKNKKKSAKTADKEENAENSQKSEDDAQQDDPDTKKAIESAKRLSRLSESEKAEKYKNGGAIVETSQKLDIGQLARISFCDFRGKKYGITYRFVDEVESNPNARGEYNHQTEVITIRIGSVEDMSATAGHELGHWLKAHYKDEYEQLQQYLKDTVFKTNYESKVAAKIEAYKKAGITIDEEAAFEELTNDCLFGVDMASSEFEEFVKANESLMLKAFRFIRELLQDLQHFMEDWRKELPGLFKNVTEVSMVQELYDDIEFMEYTADWVDRILNKSTAVEQSAASEQTTDAGEQKNSTTAESGVRYSVKDNQDENSDIVDLTNSGLAEQLEGIYGKERRKAIASYILNKLNNNTIHFIDGLEAIVDKKDANHISNRAPKNEVAAIEKFEELINKSFPYAEENNPMHNGKQHNKFIYFRYYKVDVKLGAENYSLFLNVGKARVDGKYHFYDITTKIRDTAIRLNGHERLSEYLSAYGISTNSISDSSEKSNSSFQVSDAEYLKAARNGDEAKAAEYVEQGAKEWGAFSDGKPAPINFYHGTKSFGFTEFNLKKMDDGRSIFMTSDETTAQTYSGVLGTRRIGADYSKYSAEDVAKELNKRADEFFKEKYYTLNLKQRNKIINRVNANIEKLREFLETYPEFWEYDHISNEMIRELLDVLKTYDYEKLGTKLQIGGYNRIGSHTLNSSGIDIEQFCKDAYILESFINNGATEIIVRERNPYFHTQSYSVEEAKNMLQRGEGNYSLYAKFNNPLVVDCKGDNWNAIDFKVEVSRYEIQPSRYYPDMFEVFDKDAMLPKWINGQNRWDTREQAQAAMESLPADEKPYYRRLTKTRQISEYAQQAGYDGVVFKNIRDNGGRGMKESGVADYIAVAFDSSQVKSADPITYDDEGNIIPLSERFSNDKDIRYQVPDKQEQFDIIQKANPAEDDYHTWIRSVEDIRTYDEIMSDIKDEDDFGGTEDYTYSDAKKALEENRVVIYSSKPIANGTFVTPSETEAKSFSGNSAVYSKPVALSDVAWIDELQGQYAKPNNAQKYSYEYFINKPAMKITTIDDKKQYPTNQVTRNRVINEGLKNAAEVGRKNKKGNVFVTVEETKTDVMISKKSLRHSLDRRLSINAPVVEKIGTILKNAIRVNELNPRTEEIEKSYALIGIAKNSKNEPYVVSFVVNGYSNELMSMDILYSVNAKKEATGLIDPELSPQSGGSLTASTISISDLLELVNEYFPDHLPEDVLKHFDHEARPEGVIGESALFQISDNTLTPEQQAAIERKAQRREMAKLERENENLKAALEYARRQTKISKDFRHDRSQTPKIAGKLLKQLSVVDLTESEQKEFIAALDALFDRIDDANLEGTGGSDVIYMAALEAVEVIKDNIKYTEKFEELADRAQEFADYFKGRTYISEAQAKELRYHFGGVDKANRLVHGLNFAIAKGGETTLDMKWREIMETFPDFISEELTDTDEPLAIIKAMQDARETIDGTLYSPFDEERLEERAEAEELGSVWAAEQEQMNDLAVKLMDAYTEAEWRATYADKAKGKEQVQLIRQRQELRQRMEKYRAQVNERNKNYRQKIEKNYKERYKKAISRNDLRVQMEKERLADYKAKVAESRKKATERKKQTEIKNKIRKMALELARLGGDPNKKKHLPNGLVKVTKEFLELIDTGDRNNGKLSQYVYNINDEFASINGHPGYDALSDNYNNIIKGQIAEITVAVKNKNLNQLTSSELQMIWECAKTIKHSVVHMNRFFLAEKNATPEQYQQNLLTERKGKDSQKELVAAMGIKRFIDNDLKPYYFFNKLQSPTMLKLYQGLRTGQDVWATDIREGEEAITTIKDRYNYSSWDQRKKYEFKLESGQTVSLNLQQIMSLRAYADREASYGHIYIGGIMLRSGTESTRYLKDKVTQRLDNTRYEISPADLEKITSTLSKEQTAYVIAMRNYLTSLGEKGNQVSRALFDLELFKELNYFPMRSSQEYTRQGEFKEVGEKKLKNWGNAKPLVPGADNPLVIEEFNDVWSRHVNEMALYHAFTLPLEDFQKVYGYYKVVKPAEEKEMRKNFSDEKAFEEHMPTTASIRNLFSVSEQQYISQFLRNLNGGVKKADNTLSGRGIAKYKKMSTALNLRVAVQQPGAMARAFLYINPKYFAKTAGKGFTGFKSDSKTVQEMEKYSGAAFIKSMGYFDVDTGKTAEEFLLDAGDNYKGAQKVKGFFFDGKYRDSLLLMGPEVMDRITLVQIWEATKAKVADEEGLTGKALLKRTGKVFSDVVDKTQVYDSVFTRSGHMRSTDALAKMATSFMAEPTTTINMLYDAVTQCRAGKVNKKFVAGAFASCFTATLFTNLLASVVSAMRHGKKDDNWWELWTGEFTADALNDIILLNSLPIVRDIYNLAKGFDIERADMTLISDWVSSVQKLNEASQKGELTYKEWINFLSSSAVILGLPLKSLYKDINGIFTAYQIITNGTSPTKEGMIKAIKKGTLDTLVTDDFLPIEQPSSNKYDTIYLLYAGGNKKEAEKRKEILFKYDEKADQKGLDGYIAGQLLFNKDVISAASALMKGDMKTTKSEMAKVKNFDEAIVLKAMVKMLNEQVDEDAEVTETSLIKGSAKKTIEQNLLLNNPTVRKAAIALNNNDDETRYNLQKKLVAEGYSVNDVIKVTKTVKGKMFPEEKKDSSSNKTAKSFKYTDVADALASGNTQFAKEVMNELISAYKEDGKTEDDVKKQVRSKITSKFKQEYKTANESRRADIRKLMWKSGAYDSVDDVIKAANKWVKS